MSASPIIAYPDKRLATPAVPRDLVDAELIETGGRLVAAARSVRAYGLAAAHIGEVAPVVVVSTERVSSPVDYLVLYNPVIEAVASETELGEEGSVSLEGARANVERPIWAQVSWMNETGERVSRRFEGFAARVAIHEIEQMQGIFFLDRLSRLKREMALKKARKAP